MLRLRPYKRCDAQQIVGWTGDEHAFRRWCADRYDHYPITAEDMNRMYDAQADSDASFQLTAFDETGVVGHLTMRYTDEEREEIRLGFIIVDDKRRGTGCGRRMLELAVRFAYDFVGAGRVTLGVFENNEAARRCYRAAGFIEQPEDTWWSCHILGEDWRCILMQAPNPSAANQAREAAQ